MPATAIRRAGKRTVLVERKPRAGLSLVADSCSEAVIHRTVLDYLRLVLPDALIWHPANEGKRHELETFALVRKGMTPGIPDLVIVLPGGAVAFMEVKRQAGKLRPEQQAIGDLFRQMRVPIATVRSIDDARRALASWGIKTREVAA